MWGLGRGRGRARANAQDHAPVGRPSFLTLGFQPSPCHQLGYIARRLLMSLVPLLMKITLLKPSSSLWAHRRLETCFRPATRPSREGFSTEMGVEPKEHPA